MTERVASEELMWAVRHFVYATIVESGRPPSAAETATAHGLSVADAHAALEWLDRRHALFLEPGDPQLIRMAHPFAGIPTSFQVHVGSRQYWANCAWDMLGIPAVLGADARIEATCADDGRSTTIAVEDGRVHGSGEVVHFLLPFRRWHDDLIFT